MQTFEMKGFASNQIHEVVSLEQVQALVKSHQEMLTVLRWIRNNAELTGHMTRYLDRLFERAEAARR